MVPFDRRRTSPNAQIVDAECLAITEREQRPPRAHVAQGARVGRDRKPGVRAKSADDKMPGGGVLGRGADATPVVAENSGDAAKAQLPPAESVARRARPRVGSRRPVRVPLHARAAPHLDADDDPEALPPVSAADRPSRGRGRRGAPNDLDQPIVGRPLRQHGGARRPRVAHGPPGPDLCARRGHGEAWGGRSDLSGTADRGPGPHAPG